MKIVFLLFYYLLVPNSWSQDLSLAQSNVYQISDDIIHANFELKSEFYYKYVVEQQKLLAPLKDRMIDWQFQDRNRMPLNLDNNGMLSENYNKERFDYVVRQMTRFFLKQTAEPLDTQLREWRSGSERDDEIDVRSEITSDKEESVSVYSYTEESYRKGISSASKDRQVRRKNLYNDKTVDLSSKYQLKFKPRLFQGYLLVRLENPFLNLSALAGLNGRMEINMAYRITNIDVYTLVTYDIREQKYLASIDKSLTRHLSLRYSAEVDPLHNLNIDNNSLFSVLYRKTF